MSFKEQNELPLRTTGIAIHISGGRHDWKVYMVFQDETYYLQEQNKASPCIFKNGISSSVGDYLQWN